MTTTHHGGWPKGRRRHPDCGDWAAVRLGLQSLLDQHPLRAWLREQRDRIAAQKRR